MIKIVKKYGNSAHIILSKKLRDKEVIVLTKEEFEIEFKKAHPIESTLFGLIDERLIYLKLKLEAFKPGSGPDLV